MTDADPRRSGLRAGRCGLELSVLDEGDVVADLLLERAEMRGSVAPVHRVLDHEDSVASGLINADRIQRVCVIERHGVRPA
jgi:hypothetical protein